MKYEKFDYLFYFVIVLLLLVLAIAAHGQTASGGTFTMTKTVVAGGGQTAQGAPFSTSGTAGQTIAGNTSTGGQFSLYSGFWTPEVSFVPTAATVSVGGCVLTADGRGIRNALVSVTFPNGERRTTLSGASGRFIFGDIEAGGTYIFSVASKRFAFANPTQILTVNEELDDIIFVAENQSGSF